MISSEVGDEKQTRSMCGGLDRFGHDAALPTPQHPPLSGAGVTVEPKGRGEGKVRRLRCMQGITRYMHTVYMYAALYNTEHRPRRER